MKNKSINSRPKSSISVHNLPGIINIKKNKYCYPVISIGERNTNFEVDINPKLDAEDIYKKNQELKEIIKELKRKIDFYKTNNQKLSQSISNKNKEIDELTNQIIMKNKELMTKEKKEKSNKNKKSQNNNKNQDLIISNENNLEDKLKIKKLKNEVNEVKEEMHRLQLTLLQKEEELFEIKTNKKFTDYQELKIKYETVLDEFNKLRNTKLINSDKNYFLCLQSDKFLRNEIQNLQEVIALLNQEKDNYLLEKKSLLEEIINLQSKLELANNNNKLIRNKKKLFEDKYKKNIKEQVILKEYEEEKKEMLNKINKMQKKLDYYMLNAIKNKEYTINKNNNNKNNQEENKNDIFLNSEIRRNIIKVKNEPNPEENYDNKILLMQSLVAELTKENKELLEKNRNYELKINSLLQTNKEILNSNLGLENLFINNNSINNNKNNDNTQQKENKEEIKEENKEKENEKEKERKELKKEEDNEFETISKDDDDYDEN